MDMIITIEETEEKDSSLFPHYKYPFEKFNVVQSTVFEHYQSSNNFIIASATNSGKTVMAEFFLFDALIEKKKKAIYLCPLKSLASEKHTAWSDESHPFHKSKIRLMSGDEEKTHSGNLIVATIESFCHKVRTEPSCFDDVGFDTTVFEGTSTTFSTVTQYELSRAVGTTAYLWVTLDVAGVGTGVHLNPGIDYRMISDTIIELGAGLGITPDSIIVVTSFSEEVQKPSIGFRIFKDMNDNVEYYRIARSGTTKIVKEVDINDSLIYVDDASKLPIPNPEKAIPGAIIIGGERIHYYTLKQEN